MSSRNRDSPLSCARPAIWSATAKSTAYAAFLTAPGAYETAGRAFRASEPASGADKPPRVLLADGEGSVCAVFERVLRQKGGHEFVLASDGDEAVRRYRAGLFDAVVTNIPMPKLTGIQLLRTPSVPATTRCRW